MPTNIEIKARINNVNDIRRKLVKLNASLAVEILQEDTFVNTIKGRLKLRTFSDGKGELIYYLRNDSAEPKRSDYLVYKTYDPGLLKKVLEFSLGIRGVVKKSRLLYFVGTTRIHLDEVENLGSFIEIEVVLKPEQNENEGKAIAEDLMRKLNIEKSDLVDDAYIDLLEKSSGL